MIPVVFINCSRFPFLAWILSGRKQFETRTRNTLGSLVGQRVLLAETGKGRPLVRCSAVIRSVIVVRSRSEFRRFRSRCCIARGSAFDWQPWTKAKYLYLLEGVQPVDPFCPPEDVRHGRVWMEYHPTHYLTEEHIRAERTKYNLAQLSEEQITYCMTEARNLQAMNLDVQDNSLDSWIDCIAESLRTMNENQRAQYCAEMGNC